MKKIPWQQITLYFADGSGTSSSWDTVTSRAVELGRDGKKSSDAITAEHRRALAEIRDNDTCANWYCNEELSDEVGPRADAIDWTGFSWTEQDDD